MTEKLASQNTLARAQNLRVAILAHVGIAKGHLLRAITLERILKPKFQTVLILPASASAFVQEHFPLISCEWVNWKYGLNDVLTPLLSEVVNQLKNTASDLERILSSFSADIVIGIPGFHTSAICRAIGIRHVSVLHGPWLLPEYRLPNLSEGEQAVVSCWKNAIEITDTLLRIVAQTFGLRDKGYEQWLENETVLVAQDFNNLEYAKQRRSIGFLTGEYGQRDSSDLPNNCLCVILGTALPALSADLIHVLSSNSRPVVIIGGDPRGDQKKVGKIVYTPSCAATTLARISSLAVCHGGIGTIPVFAKAAVPQLFLPHDLDQAVNTMLAVRSGWGMTLDLHYWKQRTPFGRLAPPVSARGLRDILKKLERVGPMSNDCPKVNDAELVHAALS